MITEMQVLERLRDFIASGLGEHLNADGGEAPMENLDGSNVEIDFPGPDGMRKDVMLFIQPDYESIEELSVSSDTATLQASVFILCKGAERKLLVRRVFALFAALYSLLRSDPSLEGFIESSRITDMDYYPAVAAGRTMTGIEAKLELAWSRNF